MVRELWDVRVVCGWWLEDVTWGWHRDVVHRMRVVQPHSPCTSHSSREVRLEAAIVEIRIGWRLWRARGGPARRTTAAATAVAAAAAAARPVRAGLHHTLFQNSVSTRRCCLYSPIDAASVRMCEYGRRVTFV